MIIELLLLLLLLWLWSGGFSCSSPSIYYPSREETLLISLQAKISTLFDGKPPLYEIKASRNRTYVENKARINLVLRHPQTGEFFDLSTLLFVLIHEIAHVICTEEDSRFHSTLFYRIEEDLLLRAEEKGLLPRDFTPDQSYPCQDE